MGADTVPPDLVELALWMAAEYCSTPARALSLVLPPRGKERTELWAERAGDLDGERLTDNQRALLERLPGPAGTDLAALRRLEARGLVVDRARARSGARRARTRRPTASSSSRPSRHEALEGVRAGGSHLLHGVTGSGKTEVYLRACADALERGRGVIVLVPEIALTPQTVARFQARFGDTVALLHSALGEGERYDEWRRLRSGEARIAVGPRSAVFAPVADLGLVVIDEEHDASYKHEGDPRYDARLVAAERARRAGAALVAGSATPRPETWRALPRLSLPNRVDAQALPPVRVLDMRGAQHPLHPLTRARAGGRAQVDRAAQPPRLVELPHVPRRAGRCGSARTARWRSCSTGRSGRSPATTAAIASGCRTAATRAARWRSRATARGPSGSRPSCARRSTCRCSGSTPTRGREGRRAGAAGALPRPRPPGCCSARRWSPRGTTSRT